MEANKLQVPDNNQLKSVQALCDQNNPYDNFMDRDELFLKAMKEIT